MARSKPHGTWVVHVTVDGERVALALVPNFDEAICAALDWNIEHWRQGHVLCDASIRSPQGVRLQLRLAEVGDPPARNHNLLRHDLPG